jgi:hypothetical protein
VAVFLNRFVNAPAPFANDHASVNGAVVTGVLDKNKNGERKMTRTFLNFILTLTIGALTSGIAALPAGAQDMMKSRNGYIGLGYVDVDYDSYSSGGLTAGAEGDGYEVFVGQHFGDYLSAEIAYADIDLDVSVTGGAIPLTGSGSSDLLTLRLLWHVSTDSTRPFVFLGYSDSDSDVHFLGIDIESGDSGASYGLGIDVDVSEHVSIRAKYEVYTDGDAIDTLLIGPLFRF